jgi:signal transduction histidine kinase
MDRLTSLGQLSAGVAHEIRNPLASINFNIQLLSKRLILDEKSKKIVENSLVGVDRIKSLVKGMLDFSRPTPPLLKRDSIRHAIEESVSLLEAQIKKHGIRVETEFDGAFPDVVFDSRQIQQVFVNLLLNAIEAMPEGGVVKISNRIERAKTKSGGFLVISISDTGVGIPRKDFSKIFDPFFTTKPEGTGLGLSITHKILEQHGALIDIRSREGVGTTFILRFPIGEDKENVSI